MSAPAAARPEINVYSVEGQESGKVSLPAVLRAPIRSDMVNWVHTQMAKNSRQPYAVKRGAGEETPATSWGPGRAVARVPRVPGSGTGRSSQGAFANFCRGGRMFNPNRVYRRWHRKINVNQKRYAVASALAAAAVPALVMSRGHRIENVPEVPLVVSNAIEAFNKTKEAVAFLKAVGAYDDVEKASDSKHIRAGQGKMRGRKYKMRRGPLVIYNKDEGCVTAFRNLPGVELQCVDRLNLLELAPGGHMGRFCIFSQAAFEKLDMIFGTETEAAEQKKGYTLPKNIVATGDLTRILNSEEIQSVLKAPKEKQTKFPRKKNPLRNREARVFLNPYAKITGKQN